MEIGEWRVGIGDLRMESGVSSSCVPRIVLCDLRELRVLCLHSGSVRLWGYIQIYVHTEEARFRERETERETYRYEGIHEGDAPSTSGAADSQQ